MKKISEKTNTEENIKKEYLKVLEELKLRYGIKI